MLSEHTLVEALYQLISTSSPEELETMHFHSERNSRKRRERKTKELARKACKALANCNELARNAAWAWKYKLPLPKGVILLEES